MTVIRIYRQVMVHVVRRALHAGPHGRGERGLSVILMVMWCLPSRGCPSRFRTGSGLYWWWTARICMKLCVRILRGYGAIVAKCVGFKIGEAVSVQLG